MIPVPAALVAAYGTAAWRPTCYATWLDPAGNVLSDVAVTGGRLTRTEDRWPRVEAQLTLPTALTPDATSVPVTPYGGAVSLRVDLDLAQGGRYTVPLGTLDVSEVTIRRPDGTVDVRAVSWEARVNEHRFGTLGATLPATSVTATVTQLVRDVLPGVPVVSQLTPNADQVEAGVWLTEGDRWALIERVLDSADAEAFFTTSGQLLIRYVPSKAAVPTTTFRTGDGGTLLGYESVRGWAPNRFLRPYVLRDSNPVQARTGTWTVTSGVLAAASYGTHLEWLDDVQVKALPSQATADAATQAAGRRRMAAARSTDLNVVPAPWVEPGDTVTVAMLGQLTEQHLVTSVDLDLSLLTDMLVTTRDPTY